jgi:hypothetical protein
MKRFKKHVLLLVIITLFLFTVGAFQYREGIERGEWITPGDENKDRYYNEHKISGNPEIDAIRYNHRAKKAQYFDSNLNQKLYQLDPIPLTLPKPTEPIKQLTPEAWNAGLTRQRVDNPVTPQSYMVSVSEPVIQSGNRKLVRKRRKRDN